MLKNKFGMTKVLVLVLSVLMLVSLVACNKADGPSTDDMNAAIQAAIDAANAEQAAKEAALAASIAADKAAQEAKDAAQAESLAKEKAENDAALKKAQEEAAAAAKKAEEASKAAADAAKKAAEEAAKAAEEAAKANEAALKKAQEEAAAAKKAAEEASKAAAEAAAKAQSEADRVASELAAELEAAKAEALKAQEEAAKAQEEASKAIAEASKAAEEAAKASSQLAETTVVPATTPAETTVVDPAETTVAPETTVPGEIVDKNEALLEFSKLKVKYTITDEPMYLANDYAQIVLLFDKAAIDLNNASAEAATSIINTLKVDAAAVPSAKNAAAEVQTLVAGLKDIETEVFTTQAEQIVAVRKAYDAFVKSYAKYVKDSDGNVKAGVIKDLGINYNDLTLAEAKLDVLEAYIAIALQNTMQDIYDLDARQKYDATVALKIVDPTNPNKTIDNPSDNAQIKRLAEKAHYQYLILAAINGGDVAAADLEVEWARKADNSGLDYDNPTEIFTVEELLNVYILPTLNDELTKYADGVAATFKTAVEANGLVKDFESKDIPAAAKLTYDKVSKDLMDVYYALNDAYEALSFSNDFKATATMADAKDVVETMAIKAYIDAMNVYFATAKEVAIDAETKAAETQIEQLHKDIDNIQTQIDATEVAAQITRLEKDIAKKQKEIANVEAALVAFEANVEAATLMTYDEMLNKDLDKTAAYNTIWRDLTAVEGNETALTATEIGYIKTYLQTVLQVTIKNNFASKVAGLGSISTTVSFTALKDEMKADLRELKKRFAHDENSGFGDIFDALKVENAVYEDPGYKNEAVFVAIEKVIEDAIKAIDALPLPSTYAPKWVDVTDDKDKVLKFADAAAKTYAEKNYGYMDNATTGADLSKYSYDAILDTVNAVEPLVSKDNTGANVKFMVTAEEQAIEALAKAYVDAYKAVNEYIIGRDEVSHEEVVTPAVEDDPLTEEDESAPAVTKKVIDVTKIDAIEAVKKLADNASKKIANTDKTAYDKLLKAYEKAGTGAGTIYNEMQTIGSTYTAAITTLYKDHSKNTNLKVDTLWKQSKKITDFSKNGTFVVIMDPATLKANDYAAAYDYKGFADDADAKVKEFYKNFFGIDEVNTATTATSVVELEWTYKYAVIAKMEATMKTYKNTYVAKGDNLYDVIAATALDGQYKYGETGTGLPMPAAHPYETALDTLLATAIANVKNVKLYSSAKADGTVKDGMENKLVEIEIKYNLDNAKAVIDAYYNALFGDVNTVVSPKFATDGATYKAGNSLIFKEYNTHVLNNAFGYSVVAE